MRLKSYFSGTVEAAMALARKEMGDDAMLIHSRPAQPEARHLGAYEVVFGTYGGASEGSENRQDIAEPREERPGPVAVAKRIEALPQEDPLTQQVSQLRREMERMLESLVRQNSSAPPLAAEETELLAPTPKSPQESREDSIYQWLVEQELDPPLAREAAQGKQLEDAFQVNPVLGRESGSPGSGSKRAIVALIGPPGAGKTTTLAKLAARYGLAGRKRAHILSADVLRVGAADQLRTLASLLGIGFGVAETAVDLDRMIEEQYNKDLILIDTPGLGKADTEDGRELAQMIGSDPEIDTHLVLPASMKADDLARQVDLFREFRPRKLIFTRMDETSRYGSLLSLAARTRLEVSFLAQGQRIPDDLEAATKEGLVNLLAIPPDLRPARDIHAIRLSQEAPLGRGAAA
jgi:flagellar biosynthesis protein FlhF